MWQYFWFRPICLDWYYNMLILKNILSFVKTYTKNGITWHTFIHFSEWRQKWRHVMVSTMISLFHKIFEKTVQKWISQNKLKSMKMAPCLFKKKVSHALSGSVFQTICGQFGNSNWRPTALLFHITFICYSSSSVCYRCILFSFADKKVFFLILQTKMKLNRMNCASEEPVRRRFWPSFRADKHFFRRQVLPWDDVCHASKDESHISTKEHPLHLR